MANYDGDTASSYKNIRSIIAAQRDAALESGAAFWDSYKAMGGDSSIIRWSLRKPPLAQNDYVHLTYAGADTLSRMLVKEMFSVDDTHTAVQNEIVNQIDKPDTTILTGEKNLTKGETNQTGFIISQIFRYDPDKPFIFTAPAFWLFLLSVLAGYSLVYKKIFLRNFYLLLASIFFYYKTGGVFLSLLILVTLTDFTCGLLIY